MIAEIEEEKARRRRVEGGRFGGLTSDKVVAPVPPASANGKTRRKIAESIGVGDKKAEALAGIYKHVVRLEEKGKQDEADAVRKLLNKKKAIPIWNQLKPKAKAKAAVVERPVEAAVAEEGHRAGDLFDKLRECWKQSQGGLSAYDTMWLVMCEAERVAGVTKDKDEEFGRAAERMTGVVYHEEPDNPIEATMTSSKPKHYQAKQVNRERADTFLATLGVMWARRGRSFGSLVSVLLKEMGV